MPTTKINNTIDQAILDYEVNLSRVLRSFKRRAIAIAQKSYITEAQAFDLATFALNKQVFVDALNDAGYFLQAQEITAVYPKIAQQAKLAIKSLGGPDFKYSEIDRKTFSQISIVDFDRFQDLGQAGISELHYQLYNQAVANVPFEEMVRSIEAASEGVLYNQAKTLANTATLSFSGLAIQKAGEEIGFDKPDSLWEVQGPDDNITRDTCQKALDNRVRTRQEWEDVGYWGGAPGGYNCRHWLVPYFGE